MFEDVCGSVDINDIILWVIDSSFCCYGKDVFNVGYLCLVFWLCLDLDYWLVVFSDLCIWLLELVYLLLDKFDFYLFDG